MIDFELSLMSTRSGLCWVGRMSGGIVVPVIFFWHWQGHSKSSMTGHWHHRACPWYAENRVMMQGIAALIEYSITVVKHMLEGFFVTAEGWD